jgi:zinc transport system permease protein
VSALTLGYLQRAALASALVGLAAPAVGIYVVQRRLSLMGDGIGHVAFAGAAVGVLTGTGPILTAAVAAVAGGVAIEVLRARGRAESDVALAVIFYGGIALGVLLAGLARTPASNLLSFLFGSVLTVSNDELAVIGALAIVVTTLSLALRKSLFAVCYDEEFARVSGLPVRLLNFVIASTAAITVAVAMRVVGALLIAALMVLPVASAQRFVRSFRGVWWLSLVLGCGIALGGLALSVSIDSFPGATIVVTGVGVLVLAVAFEGLRSRRPSSV